MSEISNQDQVPTPEPQNPLGDRLARLAELVAQVPDAESQELLGHLERIRAALATGGVSSARAPSQAEPPVSAPAPADETKASAPEESPPSDDTFDAADEMKEGAPEESPPSDAFDAADELKAGAPEESPPEDPPSEDGSETEAIVPAELEAELGGAEPVPSDVFVEPEGRASADIGGRDEAEVRVGGLSSAGAEARNPAAEMVTGSLDLVEAGDPPLDVFDGPHARDSLDSARAEAKTLITRLKGREAAADADDMEPLERLASERPLPRASAVSALPKRLAYRAMVAPLRVDDEGVLHVLAPEGYEADRMQQLARDLGRRVVVQDGAHAEVVRGLVAAYGPTGDPDQDALITAIAEDIAPQGFGARLARWWKRARA